jgi:predicted SprT family Zn-dependent metalloprotease
LPLDAAKENILQQMTHYPIYRRRFERQIQGQHPPTVLEAKLSHDLAYYRYFDRIAALAEQALDLKTLIEDLKRLPADATLDRTGKYLSELNSRYSGAAN